MSELLMEKPVKGPVYTQLTILVLLIIVVVLALLSAYKYFVKTPVVSPQELEIKEYTKQVQAHPKDLGARLLLGFAYQKAQDYSKASEQYNQALKLNPKELAALYNLGLMAKKQKEYDQAEKYFEKVLEIKDTHVLGSLGLGEVYISSGKYDEAIRVLDKVIEIQGQLVNPRLLRAQALEKKGDKAGALREYQEVLKYIPNQIEATEAVRRLK